jgi:hypothetical protein
MVQLPFYSDNQAIHIQNVRGKIISNCDLSFYISYAI